MKRKVVLFFTLLLICVAAAALADVEISEKNFPDPYFRDIIKEFDKDSNIRTIPP